MSVKAPTAGKSADSCRLVVLGSPAVGKSVFSHEVDPLMMVGVAPTALVVRFLTQRFIWEYDPTLESSYSHQTCVDDEPVAMEIIDTAGTTCSDLTAYENQVRLGDGFLVVYSITDRHSFAEVASIKRFLDDVRKSRNVSCVFVGNKVDLEHERQVGAEEGEKMAADAACAHFETSACDGGGQITEAFHELFREVRRRKHVEGKMRRRSSAQQVKQVFNKMFTKMQTGS